MHRQGVVATETGIHFRFATQRNGNTDCCAMPTEAEHDVEEALRNGCHKYRCYQQLQQKQEMHQYHHRHLGCHQHHQNSHTVRLLRLTKEQTEATTDPFTLLPIHEWSWLHPPPSWLSGACKNVTFADATTPASRAIRLSTTRMAKAALERPSPSSSTSTSSSTTTMTTMTTMTTTTNSPARPTALAGSGCCWHCAIEVPQQQQQQQQARQRRQWRLQVALPACVPQTHCEPPIRPEVAPAQEHQRRSTTTTTATTRTRRSASQYPNLSQIAGNSCRCVATTVTATVSPTIPSSSEKGNARITETHLQRMPECMMMVRCGKADTDNRTNGTTIRIATAAIDSQTTTSATSLGERSRTRNITSEMEDVWCFKKHGDNSISDGDVNNNNNKNNNNITKDAATIVTHVTNQFITHCHKLWQRAMMMHTTTSSRLWTLLFLMLTASTAVVDSWAGRQDVMSNCTFPDRWEGSWFLSGYQQSIHIKGSQFSYRGKCAASDGNKYLIVDEKGCHRCLVIYEKHKNVLQYKESECEGDSMYMHQSNPSAMAMHSVLKQNNNGGDHRGGAHPNTNNNNGHSRLSSSDQYIMRSNDDMNDYFCKGRETLQNLCDQIPGDALLYSLFRENAEPVKCPLKGPFIFTYNRGHGECKNPVSNIESCTEDSRLLLSFQACHDVQGTESTVEELTCLADWKDGNSRYLVGLVSHHHAISNEERYRCFVYEKINSLMGGPSMLSSTDAEYKLAQSGDATCNGLDSAEVGSRIMSLRKSPLTERCDFPAWFKGPRNWQALMGNGFYNYHTNDGSVHVFKSNGYMETRALCEQINKQTSTEMMAVVHYTTGCKSGFMCMMFYRRDTHVIEIQSGKPASRLEDACAPDHFDVNKMTYLTLLASDPAEQICPLEGLYNLRGAIGPPYMATRHKRNHNNNRVGHSAHIHHHVNDGVGFTNGGVLHKRHSTLRFRGAEVSDDRGTWLANTRGIQPARNRRAVTTTTSIPSSTSTENTADPPVLNNVGAESIEPLLVTSNPLASSNRTNSTRQHRSRRDAPICITNYKAQRQLWIGCTKPNIIDVRPLCNDDGDEEYSCHGSWAENGTVYIIARHKGANKHGVCISYRPTEGNAAKLVVGDACYRGTMKPPDHHLVANLSVFGKCGDTSSAVATQIELNGTCWLTMAAIIMFAFFYCQQQLLYTQVDENR